jgi:RNA polymerase sigma-70 factor (ECF subfamily)
MLITAATIVPVAAPWRRCPFVARLMFEPRVMPMPSLALLSWNGKRARRRSPTPQQPASRIIHTGRLTLRRVASSLLIEFGVTNLVVDFCVTELSSLVHAAQDGDRPAFGELYRRFARMVHGILLARVPYADVEDLMQDVFIAAMQQLTTLRDADVFGGWLATIARNRAIDHLRRRPAASEPIEDVLARAERSPALGSGNLSTSDPSDRLAVLAVIQSLPDAYREPLTLRLVEGMTGPEIAERTGLTPGSVRVNLHRGMKQLREQLKGIR